MTSSAAVSPWRRARRHLLRQDDLVEQTRLLFYALALLSLALTLPGALLGATPQGVCLLTVSSLALAGCWTHRHHARRPAALADVVEVLALGVLMLGCALPSIAFSTVFPAVWFRVVYGSTRDVVGYATGVLAVLSGAAVVWPAVPGHAVPNDPVHVIGTLPVLVLTVLGARHLALGLFAREQTRKRDAALASLGAGLLGVTDPREIRHRAWAWTGVVCGMTPGMRAVVAIDDDAASPLRVSVQTGGFSTELTTLPRSLLPADGTTNVPQPVPDAAPLAAVAGFAREWQCLALPESPGRYMFLGAPETLPDEAVTAIRSMNNQAALALRASEAHAELAVRALTDTLTGLANRAAFTAELDDAARHRAGDAWVLFLDLDDFKVVNDALGHGAGDRLLQHVADRIVTALRDGDLCARLGGDEFGVLLRGAGADEVRQIGARLVELVSTPLRLDGRQVQVGASVGMAALDPGVSGSEVVQRADIAMYAAKAAGKSRLRSFSSPAGLDVAAAPVRA